MRLPLRSFHLLLAASRSLLCPRERLVGWWSHLEPWLLWPWHGDGGGGWAGRAGNGELSAQLPVLGFFRFLQER